MDHRFHHPPEMMILFIDRWTRAGDIIVSSRHRSPRRPSRPLASPASRKNNTRTAHICIRKGEARDRWKRDGSKAPPSRVQEAARTWGEERGGNGEGKGGTYARLTFCFPRTWHFLPRCTVITAICRAYETRLLGKTRKFVIRVAVGEGVCKSRGRGAPLFISFRKIFRIFFFWFLGEKSCIISNYSD